MSICFRAASAKQVSDTDFCERNLNILAHAQSIELEIGSRCGGYGECGGDRIKLSPADAAKFSPITEAEKDHLSAEQLANGWRLACQCFPEQNDLSVTVEF